MDLILIVESDPAQAAFLAAAVRGDRRKVLVASSASDGLRMLEECDISLVLLDLFLSDIDGRELLSRVRACARTDAIPVFTLTSILGDEVKSQCLALGAVRHFEIPVTTEVLAGAVSEVLAPIASPSPGVDTDPLTGLPTRGTFRRAFERCRASLVGTETPLACAILAVDEFRSINYLHGQRTGDKALLLLTAALNRTLGRSNVSARWGVDEFVVLFPETSAKSAAEALQRTKRVLREAPVQDPRGKTLSITFSAGVTDVEMDMSLVAALDAADRRLHLAMSCGRDRLVWEATQTRAAPRSVVIAEDDPVTAALFRNRFEREGFDVLSFTAGDDALRAAVEHPPTLILLDVNMPGMNGFEVLERLRMASTTARIPVIMVTVMGRREDVVRGIQMGANDYILKPFSPPVVMARIRRLLKTV